MTYYVYWLHHSSHTDYTKEGYIGITKDLARRRYEYFHQQKHNRLLEEAFNLDKVLMTTLFVGSKEKARQLEQELRPTSMIGWNVAPGGMIPPDVTGRKDSKETRDKKSANNVGFKGRTHSEKTRLKMSLSHKGQVPHNKKTTHTPIGVFDSATEAALALNIRHDTLLYRIKSKSQQFTNYYYIHTEGQ